MKRFCGSLMIVLGLLLFTSYTTDKNSFKNYSYYSDYFVFIADDGETPLVIPLDINWSLNTKGYASEFKGWYGTQKDWPIAYYKKDIFSEQEEVPQESWEHKNGPYFQFNAITRTITTKIKGAPKLEIAIPKESSWVQMPSKDHHKEIYGFKTTANLKGKTRSGWMVYERIRWTKEAVQEFGDFGAFFWLPLVIDGAFYHFEQHRGKQTATKWSFQDEKIVVETLPNFTLRILTISKDSYSGRKNIPKEVQLIAKVWNLDITLKSKGAQIGHGAKFPNGLAYYRQSLLKSTKTSMNKGYGMLELILEDD